MEAEPSSPLTPTVLSLSPQPPVNLYVANLPVTWSEDRFRAHFSPFGHIESAKILTDSSLKRSRGVGFLQFAHHQHAQAAITAMDGHVISSDDASPQHQPQQQQQQQQQGQEQSPKPLVVKFATPKAASPVGGASAPRAAARLLAHHHSQSPRTPRKHLTIPSSPTASSASSSSSSSCASSVGSSASAASSASSADHNLYVAGFPPAYTRDDVGRLLTPFGPLASLRLLAPSSPPGGAATGDRKGARGGVAFARFVCIEDGDRCIAAMDGHPIEGGSRGLQVRYANRGGRMSGHHANAALSLDVSGLGAVDYSSFAAMYGAPSPYGVFDQSSQYLMSPSYGYSGATDMLSLTYSSFPYSMVDPFTGNSYYYSVDAASSPLPAAPGTPGGLMSPAAYTAFSFPSPTTASIPYPTTPHNAASSPLHLDNTLPTSTGSYSPPTTNASLFPAHLSLFLCHLPLTWNEANLLSLCTPFGHLTSARIIRDRDGASRGYGFVAFGRHDEAARAREALDGRKIDGRLVKVQWKDGRSSSRVVSIGGADGGMGMEGAMYGGLMSPTSAGLMGLAVMA